MDESNWEALMKAIHAAATEIKGDDLTWGEEIKLGAIGEMLEKALSLNAADIRRSSPYVVRPEQRRSV